MNTLKTWIDEAWARHGDAPQSVADELPARISAAQTDDDVAALARLVNHVLGEHLGAWSQGQVLLMALSHQAGLSGALVNGGEGEASIQRFAASLALCKGQHDPRGALAPPERIRATALAAASLAPHDASRAAGFLQEASQALAGHAVPDDHPAHRTLAIAGNGIAATLADKASRSDAERALMIAAAEAARVHWEKAGTWLHVERAEYRLAHTWLKAGDAARAHRHAGECLRMVGEHGNVPLEVFFGLETLVLAERALGNDQAAAMALARMQESFKGLPDEDKPWCLPSLEKLGGSA